MRHVGKTGSFVPVLEGGGKLYRYNDGKFYAVAGTKGHLWLESDVAASQADVKIDYSYFEKLKQTAIETIEKFGSFEELVSVPKPAEAPDVREEERVHVPVAG
jgi:hypothetical protein